MWLFLKRYFGWYLWLGIYASAIGALVGMAFFAFPFLPFLIFFFFYIFPLGFAFAAPLNLALLPVVFHLTRDDPAAGERSASPPRSAEPSPRWSAGSSRARFSFQMPQRRAASSLPSFSSDSSARWPEWCARASGTSMATKLRSST